jgi:hypothetical protein
MKTKTKAYLCGRMSGIPQFNFPRFDERAAHWRSTGDWDIVSPAELDDPKTRVAALASPDGSPDSGSNNGETWGDFLARDVKLIADEGIEAIICLEEWYLSKGGRLEVFIARLLGLPILKDADLQPVTAQEVKKAYGFLFEGV